jgi:2-dehydro-3-deoxyphosphogalactonate aldolase
MDLRVWLQRCPVVAILRGITPKDVGPVLHALESVGICIAEIPLNSPDPLTSISLASQQFGERMLIGAGTLKDPRQVAEVAASGGKLIVTPHSHAEIVREAKAAGLMAVPGCFSPTEAFAMIGSGADALKLFPAESLGPAAAKALRAVLPAGTMLIPVGGIDPETIPAWKQEGVSGYGVGTALYRPGDSALQVFAKAKGILSACGANIG